VAELEEAPYSCPACGATLYGWTAAHHPVDRRQRVVLDRCEACGLIVTRAPTPPDVDGELDALIDEGDEGPVLVAPNRRSLQGGLGGAQWAGLEPELRRLHPTPEAARLLLEKRGLEPLSTRTPFGSRPLRTMIQTLLNAFTLRDNFVRNARSGRVTATAIGWPAYALDWVVSALVLVPTSIFALPLEAIGTLMGRGGVMEIRARRTGA
jgi:hypothetical protein